jgi:hypothetical protein
MNRKAVHLPRVVDEDAILTLVAPPRRIELA